jgi:hypothetical protein
MSRLLRLTAAALAAVLISCASHYGVRADIGSREGSLSKAEVATLRSLVRQVAAEWNLSTEESVHRESPPGTLEVYGAGTRLTLSLWIPDDGAEATISVHDWSHVGRGSRALQQIKMRLSESLATRLPERSVRFSEVELGMWAP